MPTSGTIAYHLLGSGGGDVLGFFAGGVTEPSWFSSWKSLRLTPLAESEIWGGVRMRGGAPGTKPCSKKSGWRTGEDAV